AVAKIKERKMGMLFEGVTSYREEIEKMRAEHEREMQAEFEREILVEREGMTAKMEEMLAEMRAEMQAEIEAERRRSRREAEISRHIIKMMGHEHSAEEIRLSLSREFGLSEQEAEETFRELTE
ncbi:MAG: hypothetical protein NC302_08300, partial [Bacteroidales bacterium]|nr:hypothetical protein [Bacteroidales bacterium]